MLDTCTYCSQDDRPALAPIVAMGTRSYLALPEHQELVEGHAIIVPVTHHLSSLEADDDTWDEIRVGSQIRSVSPAAFKTSDSDDSSDRTS